MWSVDAWVPSARHVCTCLAVSSDFMLRFRTFEQPCAGRSIDCTYEVNCFGCDIMQKARFHCPMCYCMLPRYVFNKFTLLILPRLNRSLQNTPKQNAQCRMYAIMVSMSDRRMYAIIVIMAVMLIHSDCWNRVEALRKLGPIDKDLVLDVCQSNAEFAHSVLVNQQRCFSDFWWGSNQTGRHVLIQLPPL